MFDPDQRTDTVLFALEAAEVGTWSWNIRTGEVTWSQNLEAVHGLPVGSFGGSFDHFLALVHPDDRERVLGAVSHAVEKRADFHLEFRILRPDGTLHWAESRGRISTDAAGEPVCLAGTAMDITERKDAQLRLARSEEQLAEAQEIAQLGSWEWAVASDTVTWSRQTYRNFGVREGEFVPSFAAFLALVHPEDRDRIHGTIEAAYRDRQAFEFEHRIVWPDGAVRTHYGRGRVVVDGVGNTVRMIGTTQDVTEIREVEARARQWERHQAVRLEAEQAARMAERMRAVARAATAVIGARSLQELRDVLLQECERVIPVDAFLLASLDRDGTQLHFAGGYDEGVRVPPTTVVLQGTPSERVVRERRSLLTLRSDDPSALGAQPSGSMRRSESIIRTPVLADARVLGVVSVQSYTPDRYAAEDVEVLETLAALAATAMLNIERREERERAEQSLRESEERFRTVVEALGEGILITDLEDRILYTNGRNCEITGYAREELIGQVAYDLLLVPEERERLCQRNRERAAGEAERYVMQQVRRDGTPYWVEVQGNPIRDAEGQVVATVGAITDVTERRTMEESLRAAEAHYRRLVLTSPYAIYALDVGGRFTEINPAGERLLGQSASAILQLSFPDIIAPPDLEQVTGHFVQVMTGEQADVEFEARIRRPDGGVRWVAVTATAISEGGRVTGLHGIARDITEERAARERLLQSEERFRQIVDNVRHVFWMNDVSGSDNHFVSRAFEEIWGRPRAWLQSVPRAWQTTIVEEDRQQVEDAFTPERLAAGLYDVEYRITRPDGQVRWIHDRAFPIRDEHGQIYRIAGLAEDVTEHRVLETQLRQSQKMEAVGRLAGGIAHDFNNMLMAIIGHAQFVEEEVPLDSPLREDLQEIRKAAERSASLTRQLLAFSRKQILQPRSIDLNDGMRSMGTMLRPLIGEHIEVRMVLAPELPRIYADPGQIEQVIMNLVVNARDAMPEGGRLTVETRQVRLSRAYAEAHRVELAPGRYALLVVSDTGVGMDQETQARIFEPFFTTKEVGKGTGLGLSTVYGIVKQSGGFIWVYSEPGQGSTFKVYLPLAGQPTAEADEDMTGSASHTGTETILVVEDEPAVRRLVTRILDRAGYRVLEAANGAQAITVASAHAVPIDLLVTDVIMPNMNGAAVAKRVLEHHPRARVLFMSGYTDDAIVNHGVLDAGTEFIEKPFSPEALARRIRDVLDSPAPEAALR